jgi:multidrug transporter EmrE-like cation transporter
MIWEYAVFLAVMSLLFYCFMYAVHLITVGVDYAWQWICAILKSTQP